MTKFQNLVPLVSDLLVKREGNVQMWDERSSSAVRCGIISSLYFRQEMQKYSCVLHYVLQAENSLSSVWFEPFLSLSFFQ